MKENATDIPCKSAVIGGVICCPFIVVSCPIWGFAICCIASYHKIKHGYWGLHNPEYYQAAQDPLG